MVQADASAAGAGLPIRVASVPDRHSYVDHLLPPAGDRVTAVAVQVQDAGTGWAPPRQLSPEWIEGYARSFDVMHLHFGFDSFTPDELRAVVAALRRVGRPLVFTVHDLHNPHVPDPRVHRAQLDALIPAATALITLTPGAAQQIEQIWHRRATVLPHPHVVPERWLGLPRRPVVGGGTIGLALKSLRANVSALPMLRALLAARDRWPGGAEAAPRLLVDLHHEVFDPDFPRPAPELFRALEGAGSTSGVTVRVHDRFTDEELWDYLRSVDVSVLPYRFGTHSGWLEACHDLGTAAVVPTGGFWAQQQPCEVYPMTDGVPDVTGLTAALQKALAGARRGDVRLHADPAERRRQRLSLAAAHARIYAEAISAVAGRPA